MPRERDPRTGRFVANRENRRPWHLTTTMLTAEEWTMSVEDAIVSSLRTDEPRPRRRVTEDEAREAMGCGCAACRERLERERDSTSQPWGTRQEPTAEESGAEEPTAEVAEPTRWCRDCGENRPESEMMLMSGYSDRWACLSHMGRCAVCASIAEDDSALDRDYGWRLARQMVQIDDLYYCSSHRVQCSGCYNVNAPYNHYVDGQSPQALGDLVRIQDWGYLCPDCRTECSECGVMCPSNQSTCNTCLTITQGRIVGYRHTNPSMWLGGPVRRDGGYYVGFELEISAQQNYDNYDSYDDDNDYTGINVGEIYRWARENLGSPRAIECKEDSSVAGFEIVTQPMTPEFFESRDWESFFDMLNDEFPINRREPDTHGLHVHIGRAAFMNKARRYDDLSIAAYSYLLSQGDHLERIARRNPTEYCNKVQKPVSSAIVSANNSDSTKFRKQAERARSSYISAGRNAINLGNTHTIEIRAFRSTREAQDLKDAVRATYVAAEYIRALRAKPESMTSRALHWTEFSKWVAVEYPDAFASISGMATPSIKAAEPKRPVLKTEPANLAETIDDPVFF